jgi:CRISPR-associated protein Csx14
VHTTLIATLGAEPQVITLAAQLLDQAGEHVTDVVVVHTRANRPPLDAALPALHQYFADQTGLPTLQTIEAPLADVLTPAEMDAFTDLLYTVVRTWVAKRGRVHLLLAGGRKSMTMLGMSVAQLLLGPDDRLWYLHSDEGLRTSGRMRMAAGDQAELIRIPLVQRTPAPPVLTRSFQASTPAAALDELAAERARQVAHFLEHELTPAERVVALLVAREVLTVEEVATRLVKSPKTVTNQLNTIYSKLESTFGLSPDVGVKREFLRKVVEEHPEFGS